MPPSQEFGGVVDVQFFRADGVSAAQNMNPSIPFVVPAPFGATVWTYSAQRACSELDAVLGVVDEVFRVERVDVERATTLLAGSPALSARDAIHLATMERHGVARILSFDGGFDGHPGTERLGG